jgi:hypothetical protein
MIELKIQCDCGQKIKFDVEPVNNQMPFTVKCPMCGADGTAKANVLLQAQAASQPATVASLVPPVPATEQPRLRINSPAGSAALSSDEPGVTSLSQRGTPFLAAARPPKEINVQLGVVGAIVGALIGLGIWYLLFKSANSGSARMSLFGRPDNAAYFMVVIGLLAGFGAWILGGRGIDSSLGTAAAICTVLVILIGQFMFVHIVVDRVVMGFVSANDPFNKIYWKAFGKSLSEDGTTITFGLLAVAAAYAVGWGLITKVLPRK